MQLLLIFAFLFVMVGESVAGISSDPAVLGGAGGGGDGIVRDGGGAGQADVISGTPSGSENALAVKQIGPSEATINALPNEGQQTSANSISVVLATEHSVCSPSVTEQVAVAVSAAGNTELVSLTTANTIYVCDLTLIADGTVGVQVIYGTGTACATGETDMSGVMSLVANGGWTHSYGGRLKTAEANALCLELSGAVAVNGILTYRKAATF